MSKYLTYSENFKQLAKGDFIVLECLDEIPDKAFPIQKGTMQKWSVDQSDVNGFTMSRKIKGLPKQTIMMYNIFIKNNEYVSFQSIFMPYSCKFKVSIEKKVDKVNKLKTLFQ